MNDIDKEIKGKSSDETIRKFLELDFPVTA